MATHDVRDDQLPRGAGGADEVEAIPAASLMLLRGSPFKVLMIRRHARSSFVPDAWVFPGGAVDPLDRQIAGEIGSGTTLDTMRVTAMRETLEESGVWIGAPLPEAETFRRGLLDGSVTLREVLQRAPADLEKLVWTSRWITPLGIPKRFDTWFFLAEAPADAVATAEQNEAVEVRWVTPSDAIAANREGSFPMVFPTIKNLEAIAVAGSIQSLLESRRGADIRPVQPVLVTDGKSKRLVLP